MSRKNVLEMFEKNKKYMEERVNSGIEQNRKGYGYLHLTDSEGNAIKGAKIKVTQKNHEFKYGANLFMLDELETVEKNQKYKEYFKDAFNMATLPFYWADLEPERGKTRYFKESPKIYRRPSTDLCIEYCDKFGIEPREHALAYEHFFPDWLANSTVDEIKAALEIRYKQIAERYASKIPTIEVTNEMFWKKGKTAFYDASDYIEWCFKLAEKYFPNNELTINEAGLMEAAGRVTDNYYLYIENAILKGARIDAIGMQFHMFFKAEDEYIRTRKYYDPVLLYKFLDLYSNFNKPIQITEITIPAYSECAEDEEIQAEIIRMLYPIWFSHKSVEQIIYWNLVDGYAAFAPQGDMTSGENYYYGGLLRFDLTPKPAYYVIKDFFNKQWHTETQIETDESGQARFKGFYGEYDISISCDGKTINKTIKLSKLLENKYNIIF